MVSVSGFEHTTVLIGSDAAHTHQASSASLRVKLFDLDTAPITTRQLSIFSVPFGSFRLISVSFDSAGLVSVRFSSVWFDSVWFGSIQFGSVQFSLINIPLVWFGLFCFGFARFGSVLVQSHNY